MIKNFIKPNLTVRTAAHVATHASHMINRTGALFNYAYGIESMPCNGVAPPSYQKCDEDSNTNQQQDYIDQGSGFIDEETEDLNKKCRDDLNDQYKINQIFRDEIINFVREETELSYRNILDKRFKHNTLIKLGMETLAKFVFSKDHARSLVGIMASYK